MSVNASEEHIALTLRTHPKVLVKPIFIQLVLLLAHGAVLRYLPGTSSEEFDRWLRIGLHGAIFIAELVYCIIPLLRWWTSTFELTMKQVSTHEGILARSHKEMALERISEVMIEKGVLDRIFKSGTIRLYNAANTVGLEFRDVPQVDAVKELLDKYKGL